MPPGSSHRVVMIVDSGSNPFELGVGTELFGLRRPELGDRPWYSFTLSALGPVRMNHGFFTLTGVPSLEEVDDADTVIVSNRPDSWVRPPRPLLDAVRRAHDRGARLVSFCTGAFTLAHAGLLDGRRVTTHWQWADLFREMFPQVDLVPEVLYTQDDRIYTAAGSAAALDLGLHLIRQDHGTEVVNAVSRRLVFAGHRDGGQRQFVARPVPAVPDNSLADVLTWARARLDQPLTVAAMAGRAAVSQATLHRRFQAELGTTPLAWMTAERVDLARSLIERGESRLDVVARRSGLGSASNLRAHFRRRTGLTPSAYRRRFGPDAPPVVHRPPVVHSEPLTT
ncbi:helix-turn-helix domain-containing protein [Saccharothrix stipae]